MDDRKIKVGDRVRWAAITTRNAEGYVHKVDETGVWTLCDDGTRGLYPWDESSGCPASELEVIPSKPLTIAQRMAMLADALANEASADAGDLTEHNADYRYGEMSGKRDAAIRITRLLEDAAKGQGGHD